MSKKDLNTEQKIKEAARKVFLQKGFAAARTRDIAEEAGINLALLNYYFRSKEKLFNQIMEESLQMLFSTIFPMLSNPDISLRDKIPFFVDQYTTVLISNPELPTFILTEIRNNPDHLMNIMGGGKAMNLSVLQSQIEEGIAKGEVIHISPWNFLLNIVSLVVLPFMARPMVKRLGGMTDAQFEALVSERKASIVEMLINYTFTEKGRE